MPKSRAGLLQHYVEREGEQVFAPPFVMRDTSLHVLVLDADQNALNALIDRELNAPWREAFVQRGVLHEWQAVGSWFAVALLDVRGLQPKRLAGLKADGIAARALEMGIDKAIMEVLVHTVADQRELIVMIPIKDALLPGPGDNRIQQWFVPLVMNDSVPAILAGRELYGYPKIYAEFKMDPDIKNPTSRLFGETPEWQTLTLHAHGPKLEQGPPYRLGLIPVLRLLNETVPHPEPRVSDELLEIPTKDKQQLYVRAEPGESIAPRRNWWLRARYAISEWIKPRDHWPPPRQVESAAPSKGLLHPPLPLSAGASSELPVPPAADRTAEEQKALEIDSTLKKEIEYVFLRQFRDPFFEDKASYQAVITGRATLSLGSALRQLNRDPLTKFRLELPDLVSGHPNRLVSALGLRRDDGPDYSKFFVSPRAVYHQTRVELDVGKGHVLWDR